MKKVYAVCCLARQVEGDFVHYMIEYASFDKKQSEIYLQSKASEEAVVVDGIQCIAIRSGVELDVEE